MIASNKGKPHDDRPVTVKIMSYNVRNCVGLDKITDYKRIADIITHSHADVIAIQELDSATTRSKGIVVLNELAADTKMFPGYSASIDFQGGKYGIGILTKEKPLSLKKVPLPGREEKRSLLIAELQDFVVFCTHLSLTKEDRLLSVEIINVVANQYQKPVFVAGDLNTEPGSEELINLEKKWTVLNNQQDLTFPANEPNRCIDFILYQKDKKYDVNVLESRVEPQSVASDHRPVTVRLSVKSSPRQPN